MADPRVYGHDSSLYLRIEPVYDLRAEVQRYGAAPAVNVTGRTLDDFVQLVTDHEDHHGYAFSHDGNKRRREAMKLVILLPGGFDLQKVPELLRRYFHILYKTCTGYCAWIRKQGQGVYVHCLFSERPYYRHGTDQEVKARHDVYRSAATGKLCSKEDPNAVLTVSKGQQIRLDHVYFLNKHTDLQTGDAKAFHELMESLKMKLIKILRAMFYAVRQSIIMHRLSRGKMNKFRMRNVNRVNRGIISIENELNAMYEDLKAGYMLDQDSRKGLSKLISRYKQIFKQGSFKISRVTLSLDNKQPFNQLDENLESLEEMFFSDREKFISQYIGKVAA